ncbi:MAG: RNA methyltransferase, partial [Pseudomonadota bacterium]
MAEPKGRRPLARKAQRDGGKQKQSPGVVYGLHAVEFALANPSRTVHRLRLTENAERRLAESLTAFAERTGRTLPIERVLPRALDHELGTDAVHQGAVADVAPLDPPSLRDVIERAIASRRSLVVLDQVTDPHNVGAVLRSAAVFGAEAIVTTVRHSPPLGPILAKSASGALDLVPVCLVQNLGRALGEIREAGIAAVGLDGDAETTLDAHAF